MKKNRFLKVILWIAAVIAVLAIAATATLYSYLRFFIIPKINENNENSDGISVMDLAKDLDDKQIIDNIINFDKQSAVEMITAITELNKENEAAGEPVKTPDEKNADTNTGSDANTDKNKETPQNKDNSTAYQRIVTEASKEEISQGSAIMAKVDMAKVNQLRKSGDTAAVKKYIKSVLSASEISTALKLYNKYKHLL